MNKGNKTKTIGFRLSPETYEAIKLAAYDSHRSVANWVELACLWALKERAVNAVQRPRPGGGK